MSGREIVQRFLEAGLLVHPDVVRYVEQSSGPGVIEGIINALPQGTLVVTPGDVMGMMHLRTDKLDVGISPLPDILTGREDSTVPFPEPEKSSAVFYDRCDTLTRILKKRLSNVFPIEALTRQGTRYQDLEVAICGIVLSVGSTANGHRSVEVEDATGVIRVLFNKNHEGFEEAESIIPDEVIGVKGKLAPQSHGSMGSSLLFAETLLRPDIPPSHTFSAPKEPGKIAMISDVHIGSNTFLEDAWNRFSDWMDLHPEIGYLLIDGDVVDGIGIYPDQDKELKIKTIYEQYDRVAELLGDLPSHLQIVLAPGNHDAVRPAEPQPAIQKEFRTKFKSNVTFVENPSMVSIQSVKTLMYHGRSIDDLVKFIPKVTYANPDSIMKAMLQRRHLGPIYGQRTPLLTTDKDYLVIRDIPDILHTGHIHISGSIRYNDVLGINAGTWQSQTSFQKQMNIVPTPAEAYVVDLSTLSHEKFCFLDRKSAGQDISV
ncbi:MAG TPA: DNA-directed DNA polymerase II small subunit [Methanocorpusculum sp.]|nr:DNA-directed DNA polymerase II small subunit [Methanocorpusculum sp.]